MARTTKTVIGDEVALSLQIAASGDATIAKISMEIGNVPFSASGTAKRGPGDKNFEAVGEAIAIARAFENIANKLRKEPAVKAFLS